MKMHFTIVINGNDTLEKKFHEQVESNKNLHLGLIRCFSQSIMLALHLDESDNISIESFVAAKIPESILEFNGNQKQAEKKVE